MNIYIMVGPGSSFGGNSLQLETGLGNAEKINSLKIYWPVKGRQPQEISGLSMDKAHFVKEGSHATEINYPFTPFNKDAHPGHQHQ